MEITMVDVSWCKTWYVCESEISDRM